MIIAEAVIVVVPAEVLRVECQPLRWTSRASAEGVRGRFRRAARKAASVMKRTARGPASAPASHPAETPTATAYRGPSDLTEGEAETILTATMVSSIPEDPSKISTYLFDLIREGLWKRALALIQSHPHQSRYVSPYNGRTPLHEVVFKINTSPSESDTESVTRNLVFRLVDVNPDAVVVKDFGGNTPVHLFVFGSDMLDYVRILVQFCPEVSGIQNETCSTPLHLACDNPTVSVDLIELLLEHDGSLTDVVDRFGRTPLFRYAVAGGRDVEVVEMLVGALPPGMIFDVDVEGNSILHHPSQTGNAELLKLFLALDTENTLGNKKNNQGHTPLHRACQSTSQSEHSNLPQVVELLLKHSPESTAETNNSSSQYIPLHYACKNHYLSPSVVHSILSCDSTLASIADAKGYTSLHFTCQNSHPEAENVSLAILDAHPSLSELTTHKGDTPLHLSCTANTSVKTVQKLLSLYPEALQMQNDYGFAPIHCICRAQEPKEEILTLIVNSPQDCANLTAHGGDTPLHLACRNSQRGSVRILQILLKAMMTTLRDSHEGETPLLHGTNNDGNTPLHEGCFRLAPHDWIDAIASSQPHWIFQKNNSGVTPLHLSCKSGGRDSRIPQALLRHAEICDQTETLLARTDRAGCTALHSVCHERINVEFVSVILEAHPKALSTPTIRGDLPLHLACLRNAPPSVICKFARRMDTDDLLRKNLNRLSPLEILMRQCTDPRRDLNVETLVRALNGWGAFAPNYLFACFRVRRNYGMSMLTGTYIRDILFPLYDDQIRESDKEGNSLLHLEAGVIFSDRLSSSSSGGIQETNDNQLTECGVVEGLLESYPEAAQKCNKQAQYPLDIMLQTGRRWDQGIRHVLQSHPQAICCQERIGTELYPGILAKVGKDCDLSTMFAIMRGKPDLCLTAVGGKQIFV